MDPKERASKGGEARAAALSAETKRDIARNAAAERWAKRRNMPKETHSGVLKIGAGIPCAVLSNGARVISVAGLVRAFGSAAKGRVPAGDERLPVVAAANLRPFIGPDLLEKLAKPVEYRRMRGATALGFEAEILHRLCDVLLDARHAGVLRKSQHHIAAAAELMMRGFAQVGIVALIDEATGYQAERARDELHKILAAYISKELLPWTKKFPDEFFEQIYRLHGWRYQPGNTQRPGYVGRFINRYIYEALPPGVLHELRRKNPPVNGHRRHKHFQLLTDHTGNPHLDRQIVAITTTMKLSDGKDDFTTKCRRLFPKRDDQLDLELMDDGISISLDPSSISGLADVVSSPSETALALLRTGNTLPTKHIARAVYNNDSEYTMGKTRQLLLRLRNQGLIESPSPGLWRVCVGSPE